MTTMIVADLGRIPMSPYLTATLTRAADYATAQAHREVTLEHLLLALAEDPEATVVLKASSIDLPRLTAEVSDFLGRSEDRIDPAAGHTTAISADLKRILEAAAAAARQGRRREINGAIVLAAIVGDARSTAANLLRVQGLTFEEAIRALQSATSAGPLPQPGPPQPAPMPAPPPEPARLPPSEPAFGAPPHPSPDHSRSATTEEILAAARERLQKRSDQEGPAPPLPRANYPDLGGPPERYAPQPAPAPPPQPSDDDVPRTAGRPPGPPPPGPPPAAPQPTVPPLGAERPGAPPDEQRAQRPPQPMPAPGPVPRAPYPSAPPPPAPSASRLEQPYPPPHETTRGGPPRRPPSAGGHDLAPPAPPSGAERRRTNPTGPFVGSWPLIEAGQLVENIPRKMRLAIPMVVEARIARADVKALAEGLQGGGGVFRHEIVVTKAMSVRLRAPYGGFTIENRSPETQWIENVLGSGADDFASWRWTVTPYTRGRRQLQLIVSARTVGADGMTAETALPDQMVDVKVTINYGRTIKRWLGWIAAAVAGGLLAKFGETGFVIVKLLAAKYLGA
jgi:hypothetical protein